MDVLDIFITNVPEVVSLGVTCEVVIDLGEHHAGDQLCVLRHGKLVWQFGNLTTHFEDLLETWRTNTHM